MSLQPELDLVGLWFPLEAVIGSDSVYTLTITQPGTTLPYDLTGATVSMVIKPSRYAPDIQGTTYTATVANPTSGIAVFAIPASNFVAPGVVWYRAWITAGASEKVVNLGPLTVQAA